jgi:RimJ/RimL family protein N-acetyltransferase
MRAYKPEDFLAIEPLDSEKKNREGQDVAKWAEMHGKAGPAVTFTDPEGGIVFCCGVMDLWPGVGQVWALFSSLARRYPHTLQAMKWAIRHLFEKYGYVRIQTTVAVNDEAAIRFDEKHLGFKREGIMRRYGLHGEDHILFALLKEN